MKKHLHWLSRWFYLPYRLFYLCIYFSMSKILNIRNEKFRMFYNKKERVIYSGWEEFYDANTYCKECIMSLLEPLSLILFLSLHILILNWITGLLIIYSILYNIFRFDFYVTIKYLRNYKTNKLIREYVGDDLYYYAKFNYQDLTLIFPELIDINNKSKIHNCPNSSKKTLEMCKEIWNKTKDKTLFISFL